jgi:hypothetical protein
MDESDYGEGHDVTAAKSNLLKGRMKNPSRQKFR